MFEIKDENRLEIIVKYDNTFNCLENLIVSVAKWLGYNYEMFFLDCWEFNYSKNDKIGNAIKLNEMCGYDYLEIYHGLKMEYYEIGNLADKMSCLNSIKEQISKKIPVIVGMNPYWCPWFIEKYQKINSRHACLILGMDKENNLDLVDIQYANNGYTLSYNDFIYGSLYYIIFKPLNKSNVNINIRDIINNHILNKDFVGMFLQLKSFLDDINNLDFDKEIEGYENNPTGAPIFKNIYKISQSRRKFSASLMYLNKYLPNDSNLLNILSDKMKCVGEQWLSIFGMLCKAYYSINRRDKIKERIVEKITDVIKEEERIFHQLVHLDEYNLHITPPFNKELSIEINENITDYAYINIEKYFNSQGFSGKDINKTTAEISNGGRFLLSEGIKNDTWIIDDMKFALCNIREEFNDNISCFGECIILNSIDKYKYIMFLGYSEFGNHYDKVELIFRDNTKELIPIEFTSWLVKPVFNEKVIFKGHGAIKMGSDVKMLPNDVYLFAKKYPINYQGVIERIILPKCPNIHLFALTLAK